MKITRLFPDANGETHFEDVEVELGELTTTGRHSETIPARGLIFREVQADYDFDWHNAPRRQYIVNLDGAVEITAGDGETRVIGPGEVFLVEDTTGKGHISRAVGNRIRTCLLVTLE